MFVYLLSVFRCHRITKKYVSIIVFIILNVTLRLNFFNKHIKIKYAKNNKT